MKKQKPIIITAIVMAILFSATIFSACTKTNNADPCSSITCENGGTCANGVCTCPTGYTGTNCQTAATTAIQYNNNTYTPVIITVNGVKSTIAVGGSITYSGSYGSTLTGTAYTYGTTSTGLQIGTQRNWNLSNVFPSSGTSTVGIDVGSSAFYLYIKNNDPTYSAKGLYVNYGNASAQTFDNNFTIPNDGNLYGIGYYEANAGEEIYLLSSPSGNPWDSFPTFLFVNNQSVTMTLP